LHDPSGERITYDLDSGALSNQIADAFVSVASNVELIVIPAAEGRFTLNVEDVPALARGGAVLLGDGEPQVLSFTQELRAGEKTFQFGLDADAGGNVTPLLTLPPPAKVATNLLGVTAAALVLVSDGRANEITTVSGALQASGATFDAVTSRLPDTHGGGETTNETTETPITVPTGVHEVIKVVTDGIRQLMQFIEGAPADAEPASPPPAPAQQEDRRNDPAQKRADQPAPPAVLPAAPQRPSPGREESRRPGESQEPSRSGAAVLWPLGASLSRPERDERRRRRTKRRRR
jgi:hypothetical protein